MFPTRQTTLAMLCGLGLVLGLVEIGHAQSISVSSTSCAPCEQSCFTCQRTHCPPPLKHCLEGKPRIRYQHGCPKPICDPCNLPHFGYYQTCWRPWPFPADFNHCPVQGPQAVVPPAQPRLPVNTPNNFENGNLNRGIPFGAPPPPERLPPTPTPNNRIPTLYVPSGY